MPPEISLMREIEMACSVDNSLKMHVNPSPKIMQSSVLKPKKFVPPSKRFSIKNISEDCTENCNVNILIVDDSPINLMALYGMILKYNLKCMCFGSGQDAVREF